MINAERYKLLHGPYRAPRVRYGKTLFCELRGEVVVNGMSFGRIAWPTTRKKRSRPAFILCGDLVRAVRRESALAICYWFGVTPQTVTAWRKALGVPTTNEGTRRLRQDLFDEIVPQPAREKGRRRASAPEANAKKSATRKGKPIHPNTLAALRARKGGGRARRRGGRLRRPTSVEARGRRKPAGPGRPKSSPCWACCPIGKSLGRPAGPSRRFNSVGRSWVSGSGGG